MGFLKNESGKLFVPLIVLTQIRFSILKGVAIVLFFLFISASCVSQTRPDEVLIDYTCYHKPLIQVLKEISRISGANLVYSESRIPGNKAITVKAKNEKLGDVLKVILDDVGYSYQLVGNQLVLARETSKNLSGDARIFGYIRDKKSGELLIGANVFLHDKSKGTITNESGFYSLPLPKENQRLHFSYLGYKTAIVDILPLRDSAFNISLEPDCLLNEIVILDDMLEEEHEETADVQNLHIDKIMASNHLAGEPDVMRYIASQPGVTTAADGIGGLNIRGGSADQNLVMLDGVPVYNTTHAMGIFSIFNSAAIKSASVYKGGIPARYAGRLSSVIDLHTRDGNINKWHGDATLSTVAVKVSAEGPLIKDRASFIMSYRRTFMDVWIKEYTKYQNKEKKQDGSSNYFFNDINAKLNIDLSKSSRLMLQMLHSNDLFEKNTAALPGEIREEADRDLRWGNKLYSARLNNQLSKSAFARTTAYMTQYDFSSYTNNLFEIAGPTSVIAFDASLFRSSVRELGVRQDFDLMLSAVHTLRLGGLYQKRQFDPGVITVNEKDFEPRISNVTKETLLGKSDFPKINSGEINIYAEDLMKLGGGVSINAGLNYSRLTGNPGFGSLQPRISLLAGSESLHFKAGVSRLQQYMHLLTNNGLGFPSDVWLPASKILPPQKSWLFNAGFGIRNNEGYKVGTEVYFKTLDQITSYREGANQDIANNTDWQSEIPVGEGYAYGLEAYAEKSAGKTLFNFNYTYSVSDRKFADLNLGRKFPFALNRTHSFKASFTYRLSDFSEFIVNWAYLSGNYYSQPINVTVDLGRPVVIFSEKNNAKFAPFHRLDMGFSFYNAYKWGRAKFFIGVYNAYNRNNPFYTELVRDKENDSKFEFRQFSLLPLLPTISYSVSF